MKQHTIFYDAQCPLCVREMALTLEKNRSGSLKAVPVQGSETELAQYGISPEDAMTYIHIVRSDGTVLKGMGALRLMYAECEGRPLSRIWNLPLLRQIADWGYPLFARNRYRLPRWLLPRLQMYLKNGRAWATTVELCLYIELLKLFLKQAESFHKIQRSW